MNTSLITNKGKVIMLNRAYKESPDYNPPTKFQICSNQTNPVLASTSLPNLITLSTGTSKTLVSGYPTFDETNHQVTLRGYVNANEANGESVDGAGLINSDDELHSLDKFNDESKSASDEFALIWCDRII